MPCVAGRPRRRQQVELEPEREVQERTTRTQQATSPATRRIFPHEAYAETRHLLGPLLDVLGEGEIVHNRDSGLVDRSQSGGDEAGDLP